MVSTYANVSLDKDSGRLLELFSNSSGITDRFPSGRYSFRKLFGIILDDFFIVEVVIPFYLSQDELPLSVVTELIGWHKDRHLPIPVELSKEPVPFKSDQLCCEVMNDYIITNNSPESFFNELSVIEEQSMKDVKEHSDLINSQREVINNDEMTVCCKCGSISDRVVCDDCNFEVRK